MTIADAIEELRKADADGRTSHYINLGPWMRLLTDMATLQAQVNAQRLGEAFMPGIDAQARQRLTLAPGEPGTLRGSMVGRDYPAELQDILRRLPSLEANQTSLAESHARVAAVATKAAARSKRAIERCERVSDGAQRDTSDLNQRLGKVEARLLPPDPENSWCLPTAPEIGAALERIDKDVAALRARLGDANLWTDVSHVAQRVNALETRVTKGFAHLNAQWENLRKKLRALLSLDRDGSGTAGTPGGTSIG